MASFPSLVYLFCVISCLACTLLLVRGYLRNRERLLLWSALCFIGLSINNLFLFLDIVIFPQIDLQIFRQGSALIAACVLLYGFIWEAD